MTPRVIWAVGLVSGLMALAWAPPFYISLLSYVGLYSLVTVGLVLLTGVAGVTSLGQAAFVGMGAYTTAALTTLAGWSPWLTLPAGLLLTGISALVLGMLTIGLSGHYLALGTLAWALGLYHLMGSVEVLGGHTGLTGVPKLPWDALYAHDGRGYAALIWGVALLALGAAVRLLRSRKGRAVRAVKGGEEMPESFGVNTYWLKIQVFVLSALLASVSGWLYAHLVGFVNPTPFGLYASIEYLFMAVVGGAGVVWGALLGAGVLTMLRHWLQDALPALLGHGANYEIIVLGAILLVVMQRARQGLAPVLARWVKADAPLPPAEVHRLLPRRRQTAGQGRTPLLSVRGVSKRFGGLVAVNSMDFELHRGEILGLIGPNGAGKSTTFNLITNVLPVSEGTILFEGQPIEAAGMRRVCELGVARTFQHVQLVPGMLVLDNVALGAYQHGRRGFLAAALGLDRRDEDDVKAVAAQQLRRVGLDARWHVPAGSLSLGEQRLVEVARALMTQPTLLLLDEPAAGLRHLEKQALAKLLRTLRDEGLSILLVEHDMDFVMNLVDRLVVMNFGQKLSQGQPAQIRRDPQVIEAYLGEAA